MRRTSDQLIFGSEFTALLAHPEVSREVNYEAIHHYLSFICCACAAHRLSGDSKARTGSLVAVAKRRDQARNDTGSSTFPGRLNIGEQEKPASACLNCCVTPCACA